MKRKVSAKSNASKLGREILARFNRGTNFLFCRAAFFNPFERVGMKAYLHQQ